MLAHKKNDKVVIVGDNIEEDIPVSYTHLVPNATIVSPIKNGLILKVFDILAEELTKKSAPIKSNKNPVIKNI